MKRVYHEGDEPVPGAGYRLVGFLGQGGFGEVWKATAPGGAEAAVKIIRLDGAEGRKEFRALQLVKRIRHPNLMPLVGFWLKSATGDVLDAAAVTQTELWGPDTLPNTLQETMMPPPDPPPAPTELIIVMGLGDKSLYDRLQECRTQGLEGIPVEELLGYMEDSAEAIDFLNSPVHDHGAGPMAIQHCDIKPHNLMIVGGAVQVCDFGLARMMGVDRITTGAASIAYAAPELLDANNVSPSTDQYSLAITYYELRTGRLPYRGETISAVLDAKNADDYDFTRCSPAEQKVLQRAAAQATDKRFRSARDMVRSLRQATVDAEEHDAAQPSTLARRRWSRATALRTLVFLSVLGGLAVGLWIVRRPPPSVTESEETAQAGSATALALPLEALLERGTESLENRRYDTAIADFTQATGLAPRDVRPLSRRGTAWLRKGEYGKAVEDFTRAIEIAPDVRDYINRGVAHRALEQYPQAIADFDAAIHRDPSCAAAFYFRGYCHFDRERYGEAVSDLTEAIQRAPGTPDPSFTLADAYTLRGHAYALEQHPAEAVKDLTQALRLEPRDPVSVHKSRADAHEFAGHPRLAKSDRRIAALLEAIGAKPDDPAPLRELALTFATHPDADFRNGEKAVELAARACKLTSNKDPANLDALAAAYAELGRFDDATRTARTAVQLAPDGPAATHYRERLAACEKQVPLRMKEEP